MRTGRNASRGLKRENLFNRPINPANQTANEAGALGSPSLRTKRSNPSRRKTSMDCFVRFAPRNDSYAKTARRANHFVFSEMACPASFAKIFRFAPDPNQMHIHRRPVPKEGRCATSSTRGGIHGTPAVPITQ